jgi:ribosomal protein S18 acetylase RimI-like enzyme
MRYKNLKITKLSPDEWQKYRDLRLEALQADSHAFGSFYVEEVSSSETQWRARIDNMWFALVDDQIVGMIGLLQDSGPGAHRGQIISLWIKPAYRGQGIGKKLVKHVQAFATAHGLRKLYLHVTSTQEGAINIYKTCGFTHIGFFKNHVCFGDDYFDTCLMEWQVPGL